MYCTNPVNELIDCVNDLLRGDRRFEGSDEVGRVVILVELIRFTDGVG